MSDLLGRIEQQDVAQSVFNTELLDCQKRCSIIDFMRASEGDYAFQTSALALLDWAPLIDDFKKPTLRLFAIPSIFAGLM